MSHVKPWQICAVATFTLAALVPAVPAASAGTGDQYANQTPYGNPKDTSIRKAPAGYSMFFIETVGRHGARSLVDDGPEQAALRIWKKAEEKKALTETGTTLARDIKRFQTAERGIGYGNLSGLGREEMRGIGRRTADNYASFFSAVRKKSETIATQTTDVTRTKQSASSLHDGLEDGVGRSLDSLLAKPVEANDLMRFRNEASSAGRAMIKKVHDRASVRDHAKHLLGASYKRSFVDSIDDPVDAALDIYKLYITAPGMQKETNITFARYVPPDDREALSYATDVETFYRYGPGVKGETNTFSKARPLLKDFFSRLDKRIDGGSTAAVFRVGHGETTMPFAALIRAPGSHVQMPKGEPFSRDKNRWRGSVAGRLSGNLEWAAYRNKDGKILVTMRYNEEPVQFNSGCTPAKENRYFYRVSELKNCLG
jgi:hypothetical protein